MALSVVDTVEVKLADDAVVIAGGIPTLLTRFSMPLVRFPQVLCGHLVFYHRTNFYNLVGISNIPTPMKSVMITYDRVEFILRMKMY